jgi:DNA-directed RNA polymerase specialized sigma24 family protein
MSKSFSRTQAVTDSVSISEEDDRILIRHIAAKDREAFKTLYYRYAPRLGGYLSKLLKSRELVEEVINDVMLVVWQNAVRFEPTGRLSTWLFGITHRKALKALARSSRLSPDPLPVPLRVAGLVAWFSSILKHRLL